MKINFMNELYLQIQLCINLNYEELKHFFLAWGPVFIFTPHVQRERGKVIGCGVHIYVCG